jgi:hypothetical protein
MRKLLFLISILLLNCYPTATVKKDQRPVAVFYSNIPEEQYNEVGIVVVDFRERGIFTGKGSSELMISKLKVKAVKLEADAIIKIKIESEPISQEMNSIWKANAIAIKFMKQ